MGHSVIDLHKNNCFESDEVLTVPCVMCVYEQCQRQ